MSLKFVARIKRSLVTATEPLRVTYPPFDVVVAEVGGQIYAIEDACNHAGASLSEGPLEGANISCPMHGYIFDIRTGELKSPRGLCPNQRTFVVTDEGEEIVIWDSGVIDFKMRP